MIRRICNGSTTMKRTALSTVLAVFALVSTDGFAQDLLNTAPSPGRPHGPWYGSISGGYAVANDISFKGDEGTKGRFSLDGGYAFAGAIGYKWPKYLRTEFEVGYQANTYDKASMGGDRGSLTSDVQYLFYSVNAYHDFTTGTHFLPYFGGGVGGVHETINDADNGGKTIGSGSREHVELHGEVGLHYDLGRDVNFGPSYRFIHIFDGENGRDDTNLHQLKVGLSFPFR